MGFPGGSDGKASAYNGGGLVSIPGQGRFPGEGNGNPVQYSCLENSMDRGAWQATVHEVAKNWIQLSNFTFFLSFFLSFFTQVLILSKSIYVLNTFPIRKDSLYRYINFFVLGKSEENLCFKMYTEIKRDKNIQNNLEEKQSKRNRKTKKQDITMSQKFIQSF